jgi:hypothetical protein
MDFTQFQYLFFQTVLKFKTYYDQDNNNQKTKLHNNILLF